MYLEFSTLNYFIYFNIKDSFNLYAVFYFHNSYAYPEQLVLLGLNVFLGISIVPEPPVGREPEHRGREEHAEVGRPPLAIVTRSERMLLLHVGKLRAGGGQNGEAGPGVVDAGTLTPADADADAAVQ